ncbi:hypothetical protein A4D02_20485 [Niastella koreensis]|uniref:Uncharacterized protein n=3 Tax=Niastella koreensis TaxID=354356 RepID=G8TKB0_NIAKG|nr:hypothetical protein Niako_0144 [Niastella koreensis GR20-10]OQP54060.1 hypothetical protein A4D02_20485 [Niastella koreensis]
MGIAYTHPGLAQTSVGGTSRFYAENVKQVDDIIKVIKAFCDSIKPVQVSDRNIKFDKKNILYVNNLFNTVISDKAFAQETKKNDLIQTSSLNAGLIGYREYKFYPPNGYLDMSIVLTVIDDNILYKKVCILSPLKRKCATDDRQIPFFDFMYLQKEIVPLIDFPIKNCINCDSLKVDTLYQSVFNEMAKKYPAYKFTPVGTTGPVKQLIFNNVYLQVSTYNNKNVPDLMAQLVKLQEYDAIKNLLYSPNQLMAINAYEALVYLKSKVQLPIDATTDAKMKEILNSNIQIPVYCGRDCKPTNFAYNTLKIKDKDIYDKYAAAFGE